MNTAHWHLILNHVPIIGAVIGLLVLAAGFVFRNQTVKRTSLGIFVFAALFAIPAYLTGEGAEDLVENLPGVNKNIIEKHEEGSLIFLWVIVGLGALACFTLFTDLFNSKLKKTLYVITLLLSLISTGIAKQLATSGGEIRHTEIRQGDPSSITETGEQEDD